MNIGFRRVGDVEIDHMAETGHINAARGNISGDQRLQPAITEITKNLLAQPLTHVAMQRVNGKAPNLHEFCQRVSASFGAHKDKALAGVFVIQHIAQPVALVAFRHQGDTLGNLVGGNACLWGLNMNRVNKHALGECLNRLWHGRREQHRLAIFRQFTNDPLDRLIKAEVKHMVGLVKHKEHHARGVKGAAIHQIYQPPGGCDHHINAAPQTLDLGVIAGTAEHCEMA